MSVWGRPNWGGRFSPVGPYPPRVSDNDYSYITADDTEYDRPAYRERSPEGDDVIYLRKGRETHSVAFPPYSIDDSRLTVGTLRAAAAEALGLRTTRRLNLFYKGRNLKDDYRTCLAEGLKVNSELMCVESDEHDDHHQHSHHHHDRHAHDLRDSRDDLRSEEDDGSTGGSGGHTSPTGGKKKKKHSSSKKKSKSKALDSRADGVSSDYLAPQPASGHGTSRTNSPAPPPPAPKSPIEKLGEISTFLQENLVPMSVKFATNPPSNPKDLDFEHKKLTEGILSQVMMKADGVEVEGDSEARSRRKELIKESQDILASLDAIRDAQK